MALGRRKNPNSYFGRLTHLKKLFWLYFLLLIFEGALRKWVAPQLSAPLLIIRDPVSVWIIWEAFRTNKWPARWSSMLSLLTVLMVGLFVVQIIAGDNPLLVGLFGLRSYLLPFPVLFIMGESLDEEDILKMGACTLWLLAPMTLLEVAQYASPSSSFLNKGAYEGGKQIGYVGAHVRAAGTFSFNIGSASFAVLAAAFIYYGMVRQGFAAKWLLWIGAFALMLSVPMVGSRGLVFQLAAVTAFVGLCALMGVSQFSRALRIILPVLMMAFLVSLLPIFTDASRSLAERFAGAERGAEGDPLQSIVYRVLRPVFEQIEGIDFASNWMGQGMGRGAVAVSAFLQGGTPFAMGENEIEREVAEMGPLGGPAFALFKLFLAIMIFGEALARARDREPLAMLLIPLALSTLLFGAPEQPTVQGFMVIGMAFCIAATKMRVPVVNRTLLPAVRGQRIVYRSQLHRR